MLRLIKVGKTNRKIADNLGVRIRAVEDRWYCLTKETGAKTVVELE